MNYRLSSHAEQQLRRRQIDRRWLESLLDTTEQRIAQPGGTEIWHSRFAAEDGKMYLFRAVVAVDREPYVVVTVYRTSNVEKYWRAQ